jgi:hypothetical protein
MLLDIYSLLMNLLILVLAVLLVELALELTKKEKDNIIYKCGFLPSYT